MLWNGEVCFTYKSGRQQMVRTCPLSASNGREATTPACRFRGNNGKVREFMSASQRRVAFASRPADRHDGEHPPTVEAASKNRVRQHRRLVLLYCVWVDEAGRIEHDARHRDIHRREPLTEHSLTSGKRRFSQSDGQSIGVKVNRLRSISSRRRSA
jgi:hypothetical protein